MFFYIVNIYVNMTYRKHLFRMYMYICFGLNCKFILHNFDYLNYGLPMLQSAPLQPAVHTLPGQIPVMRSHALWLRQ